MATFNNTAEAMEMIDNIVNMTFDHFDPDDELNDDFIKELKKKLLTKVNRSTKASLEQLVKAACVRLVAMTVENSRYSENDLEDLKSLVDSAKIMEDILRVYAERNKDTPKKDVDALLAEVDNLTDEQEKKERLKAILTAVFNEQDAVKEMRTLFDKRVDAAKSFAQVILTAHSRFEKIHAARMEELEENYANNYENNAADDGNDGGSIHHSQVSDVVSEELPYARHYEGPRESPRYRPVPHTYGYRPGESENSNPGETNLPEPPDRRQWTDEQLDKELKIRQLELAEAQLKAQETRELREKQPKLLVQTPPFTGKEDNPLDRGDFKLWLSRFETLNPTLTGDHKLATMIGCFTNKASMYFNAQPDEVKHDLEKTIDVMTKTFTVLKSHIAKMEDFEQLVMRPDQSVDGFYMFDFLPALRVYEADVEHKLPDSWLKKAFNKRLHLDLRDRVQLNHATMVTDPNVSMDQFINEIKIIELNTKTSAVDRERRKIEEEILRRRHIKVQPSYQYDNGPPEKRSRNNRRNREGGNFQSGDFSTNRSSYPPRGRYRGSRGSNRNGGQNRQNNQSQPNPNYTPVQNPRDSKPNERDERACFNCDMRGHIAANCRKPPRNKQQSYSTPRGGYNQNRGRGGFTPNRGNGDGPRGGRGGFKPRGGTYPGYSYNSQGRRIQALEEYEDDDGAHDTGETDTEGEYNEPNTVGAISTSDGKENDSKLVNPLDWFSPLDYERNEDRLPRSFLNRTAIDGGCGEDIRTIEMILRGNNLDKVVTDHDLAYSGKRIGKFNCVENDTVGDRYTLTEWKTEGVLPLNFAKRLFESPGTILHRLRSAQDRIARTNSEYAAVKSALHERDDQLKCNIMKLPLLIGYTVVEDVLFDTGAPMNVVSTRALMTLVGVDEEIAMALKFINVRDSKILYAAGGKEIKTWGSIQLEVTLQSGLCTLLKFEVTVDDYSSVIVGVDGLQRMGFVFKSFNYGDKNLLEPDTTDKADDLKAEMMREVRKTRRQNQPPPFYSHHVGERRRPSHVSWPQDVVMDDPSVRNIRVWDTPPPEIADPTSGRFPPSTSSSTQLQPIKRKPLNKVSLRSVNTWERNHLRDEIQYFVRNGMVVEALRKEEEPVTITLRNADGIDYRTVTDYRFLNASIKPSWIPKPED